MLIQPVRGVKVITATELSGKNGRLAVVAGPVGGRTVLRSLHSEGTLKAMRVHHLDPSLPAMAFLTIASPGSGVLQGEQGSPRIAVGNERGARPGTPAEIHAPAELRCRAGIHEGAPQTRGPARRKLIEVTIERPVPAILDA